MRKLFFSVALCVFCWAGLPLSAQEERRYRAEIDLSLVQDDKLQVQLYPPSVSAAEVEFHMPKIVPGTYEIYDFGRFLSDLKAEDEQGQSLLVERLSENRWRIAQADKLHKLSYWVEDTYDTEKPNVVFEPAGTSIEEDRVFVINTHGFFGYLKGMKELPYEVSFQRPENFYGSTSLKRLPNEEPNKDVFEAEDYMRLVDSPLMYCVPDTAKVEVGGAEVLVSVYSPNDRLDASFVMRNAQEVLEAQKTYLGGDLPVDRYAFIIYLFDKNPLSGMLGALEHSYSSFYCLPERMQDPISLAQLIKDVAAHEFFHIITPLSIHSEEIGNFDYIEPKMSRHLWLYEGVVEYFAGHVQVRENLMDKDQYLVVVEEKIRNMQNKFNDNIAFTELSLGALKEHKDEYGNVYEKGAIIGLCLDIELLRLSRGEMSLMDLMHALAKTYGKDVSFQDDQLFDKIAELSHPDIKTFLTTYVAQPNPLPLKRIFQQVGIAYQAPVDTTCWYLDDIALHPSALYEARGPGDTVMGLIPVEEAAMMEKGEKNMGTLRVLTSIAGHSVRKYSVREISQRLDEKKKVGRKVRCRMILIKPSKKKRSGFSRKSPFLGKRLKLTRGSTKTHARLKFIKTPSPDQTQAQARWLKGDE